MYSVKTRISRYDMVKCDAQGLGKCLWLLFQKQTARTRKPEPQTKIGPPIKSATLKSLQIPMLIQQSINKSGQKPGFLKKGASLHEKRDYHSIYWLI